MKKHWLAFSCSSEGRRMWLAFVLLAVAAVLLGQRAQALWQTPFPLALLAAIAAYLPRRRLIDALLFGMAVLFAEVAESQIGPQLLASLMLFPLALTRRPKFSLMLGAGCFLLLLVSIQLKYQFAGTPLTWQDLRFFFLQFRDNVGVMTSQPTLLAYGALGIFTFLSVLIGLWRWEGTSSVGQRVVARYVVPVMSLLLVAWSANQVASAAAVQRDLGAWAVSEASNGVAPLSRFFATAYLKPVVVVSPVKTTSFQDMLSRYMGASVAVRPPADLLLFLQESQFNPAAIEHCPNQLCDIPIFQRSQHTAAYGPLRVHVFGGGTWLTEFSLFSGVPHTIFGSAGDFAPFNVAPGLRRSFVRSLRDAGYRTVAVYPVRGGMMNARKAYEAYGFDKFYDAADLGLPGRYNTSDALMHEAALRVLHQERQHGRPLFLMVVTIFNHGEHGVAMDRVPAELVRQTLQNYGDVQVSHNVADYLWRTQEFQRAMDSTTRVVLNSDKPVVLAWFGDHQPPFGNAPALRTMVRPVVESSVHVPSKYLTWYHVASNVPGQRINNKVSALDVVFLPGTLAQMAGAKLDDWLAANVVARDLCNGLLLECREPAVRDAYYSYLVHDLKSFALP